MRLWGLFSHQQWMEWTLWTRRRRRRRRGGRRRRRGRRRRGGRRRGGRRGRGGGRRGINPSRTLPHPTKRSGKPGFSPWLFSSIFLSDTHNISLQSKQL